MSAPGDEVPFDVSDEVPVDGPETVAEKRLLASLGRQARTVNLARVVRLVALLDASDAGSLDDAGWLEAENLAHQVVGSAGTFGFPTASVEAVAIEDYFAAGPAGPPGEPAGPPDLVTRPGPAADAGLVRRTLERLREQFRG